MRNSVIVCALLALSAPAGAVAADKQVAPAATRSPAKTPQPGCNPADPASCQQPGVDRAQLYRSALAPARPAEDVELSSGLTKVMGDLMAAGRCGDAVQLARRDGHGELAARAQQLCK